MRASFFVCAASVCLFNLSIYFLIVGAHRRYGWVGSNSTSSLSSRKLPSLDGCGLTGGTPTWTNYSSKDHSNLATTRTCLRRIHTRLNGALLENEGQRSSIALSRLLCTGSTANVTGAEAVLSILSQYERIWFIGDSVMEQQFMALLCMANPTVVPGDISGHVGPNMGFMPKMDMSSNLTLSGSGDAASTSSTTIRYTKFGYIYDHKEPELYNWSFPEAVATYTSSDAIVLNAGHHYDSSRGEILRNAARHISQQSELTNATVFFVETGPEQWPTSNGVHADACTRKCKCEVLTPARMDGNGTVHEFVIAANEPKEVDPFFRGLYPYLFEERGRGKNSSNYTCLPDCLPANWRNEIANRELQRVRSDEGDSAGKVRIVPIWRQLVAQSIVQARVHGDCTHKAVDTLIMMNEQLLRSMKAY